MKIKITEDLYVGSYDGYCQGQPKDISVIHACKSPCFVGVAGFGVQPNHPNYLHVEKEGHLYLNMIDPPKPLFKLKTFHKAIQFINQEFRKGKKVLIHCNQGQSRAPSVALVWLACTNNISNDSFQKARLDFIQLFPAYAPGAGIETFLHTNWKEVLWKTS